MSRQDDSDVRSRFMGSAKRRTRAAWSCQLQARGSDLGDLVRLVRWNPVNVNLLERG
jgi:hypothetical protein